MGEKTCIIDHHPVTYAWVKCVVVCFDSADSLEAVMRTTSVLKGTKLCWFSLVSARCAKCEKSDHMLLSCAERADIMISKGLGVATGDRTVVKVVVFDSSVIRKMEDTLKNLAIMVMNLLAKMDNAGLVPAALFS
ncbi:hypothetical protein G9A89_017943 [Geosiphon pyriformis]|nr:hypothetical protein G9A89_017943 [Geosiphon pyriformis]